MLGFIVLIVFRFVLHECKIQVHIIPHSYDDSAWGKTVDEYLYPGIGQGPGIKGILDTTIQALKQNSQRTFVFAEMLFFKKWWEMQNKTIQEDVRSLVENKQLEFVNGGWVAADEATTDYNAIIDQMTMGLRFIHETFGSRARPTVAWQLDTFGHSSEFASLLSQMSFDGLFFGGIDYQDKMKRKREKRLEFIWRGSKSLGKSADIFTGILYNGINPPPGFCFDLQCIFEDQPSSVVNISQVVDEFIKEVYRQKDSHQTNHVLQIMGNDFTLQYADSVYEKLDELIELVNKDGRIRVYYSTPSRYLRALYYSTTTWGIKTDDFYPYSNSRDNYWTGYFTSRPALKAYVRESHNLLQACKHLEVIGLTLKLPNSSRILQEEVALMQHHVVVMGLERKHVTEDYLRRVSKGREICKGLMDHVLRVKHKVSSNETKVNFQKCDLLNISVCPITEKEENVFVITIYNPIAHPYSTYLRMPIQFKRAIVLDSDRAPKLSQTYRTPKQVLKLSPDRQKKLYDLIINANLPALGYTTYFVEFKATNGIKSKLTRPSTIMKHQNVLENKHLRVEFSHSTGRITKLINKENKLHLSFNHEFMYYKSAPAPLSKKHIFRPYSEAKKIPMIESVKIMTGPLVQEVHQTFGNNISQVIRLYKDQPFLEFEYIVGPIETAGWQGKEIITRFISNVSSEGYFYTDANGREMQTRKRNHRETWNLDTHEEIAGNYYPVNSRISVNDSRCHLTVLTDRAQGGTGYKNGEVELMLLRRLFLEDNPGSGGGVFGDDPGGRGVVIRGKHRVLLTKPERAARFHREEGERMLMQPIVSFMKNPFTSQEWKLHRGDYSLLKRALPKNVRLLSLEIFMKNYILIRLEHIFAIKEDKHQSKKATVSLKNLFVDFRILRLSELNLSANQNINEKRGLHWKTVEGKNTKENFKRYLKEPYRIVLQPMEIRTFLALIEFW